MPKHNKDEKNNQPSGLVGIHKPPRAQQRTETHRVQRYLDGRVIAGTIPVARQLGHNRVFVPTAAPVPSSNPAATVHTQTFIPAAAPQAHRTVHTQTFIPSTIPPAVHTQMFVPTPPALTPALFLAASQAPVLGNLAHSTPHAAVTQTTTRLQPPGRR